MADDKSEQSKVHPKNSQDQERISKFQSAREQRVREFQKGLAAARKEMGRDKK